jgi:hypothetical protein
MAGCGRLAAGVRNPGQPPQRQRRNVQRWPSQVPPPSNPAARWPCRADTDRIARPPGRNRHRRGVRSPVHSPRLADTTADARPPRRSHCRSPLCGTCVAHPTGDAAHVSDTRCPQPGRRTGRCPPAQRPADMTVEAAAEGPQRFRPGGGTGTGCRTPDRSGSHPPWTPRPPAGRPGRTQDRTPEAADGQSADRPGSLQLPLLFLKAGQRAAGGRPRPATTTPEPRQRPHSDKAIRALIEVLQEATYRLLPNLLQGRSAPRSPTRQTRCY